VGATYCELLGLTTAAIRTIYLDREFQSLIRALRFDWKTCLPMFHLFPDQPHIALSVDYKKWVFHFLVWRRFYPFGDAPLRFAS